jgi:hypothetical protein
VSKHPVEINAVSQRPLIIDSGRSAILTEAFRCFSSKILRNATLKKAVCIYVSWFVGLYLSVHVCIQVLYASVTVFFFSMAPPVHSGSWPLSQFRNHFSQTVGLLGRVVSLS